MRLKIKNNILLLLLLLLVLFKLNLYNIDYNDV